METWNKQAHIEIWNTCRPDLCYELEPNVFKAWPWPCVLFLPFHRTSGAQWWDPILSFGQGRHHQRYTHTDCHFVDTYFSFYLLNGVTASEVYTHWLSLVHAFWYFFQLQITSCILCCTLIYSLFYCVTTTFFIFVLFSMWLWWHICPAQTLHQCSKCCFHCGTAEWSECSHSLQQEAGVGDS